MTGLLLHDYFRSSAAHRVRIALHLKGLAFAQQAHHLRRGEQRDPGYLRLNAQGLIPMLEADGRALNQSLAIIEYLDEIHPDPPLLPRDPGARARVRSLAMTIAADLHPITNLRALEHLRSAFGADDEAVAAWYRHWAQVTFEAFEARLTAEPESGLWSHGDVPTLADICLVPQVFGARRFALDMTAFPHIVRIASLAADTNAFALAEPARQPDAEQ